MLVGNGLCTIPLALALDGVPDARRPRPARLRRARGPARGRRLRVLLPRARPRRSRGRRADHRHRGRHRGARGARVRRADRLADRSGLAIALAGGCLAAAQGRRSTAAGALPAFGAALCFGLMFVLFAAAEDLGPVSVVAGGRLSALTVLCAVVLWRRPPITGRALRSSASPARGARRRALRCPTPTPPRAARSASPPWLPASSRRSAPSPGSCSCASGSRPHQYVGIVLAGGGTTLLAFAQ